MSLAVPPLFESCRQPYDPFVPGIDKQLAKHGRLARTGSSALGDEPSQPRRR